MKIKKIAVIALLFVFGAVGLVLAGEDFDFCTEGPLYKINEKTGRTVVSLRSECIDYDTFFSEDMRALYCTKGQKTKVSAAFLADDFNCEGPNYQLPDYIEFDLLKEKALDAMPAAGSD